MDAIPPASTSSHAGQFPALGGLACPLDLMLALTHTVDCEKYPSFNSDTINISR